MPSLVDSYSATHDAVGDTARHDLPSLGLRALPHLRPLVQRLRRGNDLQSRISHPEWDKFRDAGWSAYPITLGAAWPTLLPLLVEGIDGTGGALGGKTCVKLDGDRLVVESQVALDKLAGK
jgi:hypothetical protein